MSVDPPGVGVSEFAIQLVDAVKVRVDGGAEVKLGSL